MIFHSEILLNPFPFRFDLSVSEGETGKAMNHFYQSEPVKVRIICL